MRPSMLSTMATRKESPSSEPRWLCFCKAKARPTRAPSRCFSPAATPKRWISSASALPSLAMWCSSKTAPTFWHYKFSKTEGSTSLACLAMPTALSCRRSSTPSRPISLACCTPLPALPIRPDYLSPRLGARKLPASASSMISSLPPMRPTSYYISKSRHPSPLATF